MYSVVKRFMPVIFVALLATTVSISSCDSSAKREKASCDSLVNSAKQAIAQGDYPEAFALMDSVDKCFPAQVEARREITLLRSQAMTDYSQQQLIATDSLIAVLDSELQGLSPKFKHVSGDDIAGYFVASAVYNPKFLSTTSIEGRVDDEDLSFYLVAVNNQKPIGINSLVFDTPAGKMASKEIDGGSERSGDIDKGGIDLATFLPSDIENILNVISMPGNTPSVTLVGKKGDKVEVKLSPAQVQAIVDTWRFSDLASRLQRAKWLHDKYERQLIIARDHTVNIQP